MTIIYSTETPQGYPPVGVKVKTPTFGTGVVVNYEIFSDSWAEPRIGVRLDNPKLWVFSRLDPEALPYFWLKDLEVLTLPCTNIGRPCADVYNCCDCGTGNCGCRYCWSCNACENCKTNAEI